MKLAQPENSEPGHLKPGHKPDLQQNRFGPPYIFPGFFTSGQARPEMGKITK